MNRRGERHPKKSYGHLHKATEIRYQFIKDHCSKYSVKKMCHILEVSRSGFYSWCNRPKSKRKLENENLVQDITRVFKQSGEICGAIKVTNRLRQEGIRCSKNRVARLMRENGLRSKIKRKFKATTNSRHNYPVADNLLQQNFNAQYPNQVWVGDITYISTQEGWLYWAAVLDLYSRRIVG